MCLFIHEGRVLVSNGRTIRGKGVDSPIVPGGFYRVLGGSMNFNETSEQGVRREIMEELKSEINNLKFLEVVENLFIYGGEKCHEIVFLFAGELTKKDLYKQEVIHIIDNDYAFNAVWISLDDIFNGKTPLYPSTDYKSIFTKLEVI